MVRCRFDGWSLDPSIDFELVTIAAARTGRRGPCETQPRGAACICRWRKCRRFSRISARWAAIRPTPNWRRWPKRGANIAATRRSAAAWPIAGRTGSGVSRTCSRRRSSPPRTKIRHQLGEDDWCVSVFEDNAGIVRFDEQNNVCFKVETHNHPSALEPYGGANTGLGGVIRDPLGTGPGRQADLQHRRLLLRAARHAGRSLAAGRAASAARDERRRGRRARLRQPHGHSHGQRRDLLRSARISATRWSIAATSA